ncbi:MAG: hypothetical protein R2939_12865 [Kofleriaceae bacterium]
MRVRTFALAVPALGILGLLIALALDASRQPPVPTLPEARSVATTSASHDARRATADGAPRLAGAVDARQAVTAAPADGPTTPGGANIPSPSPDPPADAALTVTGPSRLRRRIRAAQAALNEERYDSALLAARALIDAYPESQEGFHIAVQAACALGDVDEALAHLAHVESARAQRKLRLTCEASGARFP